jgi:hypothetical protein
MDMVSISIAALALVVNTSTVLLYAQQADKSRQKTTATGCIERADQVASAADTAGTTTDSLHFVLITSPRSTPAVGTAGSSASSAVLKGYRLEGSVDSLNPHVGHKVEITGVVSAPSAPSGSGSSFDGPLMTVQSIKMLSETCGR